MYRLATIATYLFVVMALVLGVAAMPLGAADHLDGPMVMTEKRFDINDLYAFQSPSNAANTVLIMTVAPSEGTPFPSSFGANGAYEFKIDTDGDARENITWQIQFGATDERNQQYYSISSGATSLGGGKTSEPIALNNGGRAIAGVFDDPFFFDLAAFRNNQAFCPGGIGSNFFQGLNVRAIVIEVPSSQLGGTIGVWARTVTRERGEEKQFDRMGRPAINTVFLNPGSRKDTFNSTQPADDKANYTADVVGVLKALGNDDATAAQLAGVLLPDILTVDTASNEGFLNGRRLQDDVIDAELALITGGAVKGDCVANDSNFSTSFPYLAAANPAPRPNPPPTGTGGNLPGMPNTGAGGAQARPTVIGWALIASLACLAAASASATVAVRSRK